MTRELVPMSLKQANAFVALHHRHCDPVAIHRSAIGCEIDGQLVGVAIIGNPKSRVAQQADRFLIEILRVCVMPGAPRNTSSWLYSRARRAAGAMGFRRVSTKNLQQESGASLRAAGFQAVASSGARKDPSGWGRNGRPRRKLRTDGVAKVRWEARA